ncbi:MAG: hypothetical protein ACRD2L_10290 [Terriglobia bacterium]
MNYAVTIELADGMYKAVQKAAEATGQTPAEWVVTHLPHLLPPRDQEQHHPQIPAEIFALLQQIALRTGKQTKELAAEWLTRYGPKLRLPMAEEEQRAAWERLQQHFGAVNLGSPTGADNESIDADLAREYNSRHEETL